jgi:hypothetical protein
MSAHYFLVGTDGRPYGPLSEDGVRTFLTDGRAGRYSRARRDTEDQWIALKDMPEFEEDTRPPHLGGGTPSEAAPDDDALRQEPRRTTGGSGASGILDPVSCFRRAWWVLAGDFPMLAGWTLLVAIVISVITLIPKVGIAIGALVNNVLMCGVYVLYLSRMRGFRPSLNDVAASVWPMSARIVLVGIAQSLLTAPIVLATLTTAKVALGALLVTFVPCLYLLVAYVFVLPLIVDRQLPVWRAMELSRKTVHRTWLQMFGLLLAAGMLLFLSTRLFGVLLVVTLPLCTATLMVAYEDLFGSA